MRKTTVGCWPGAALETETISAFRPFSCVDLWGTVCAPMTEASNSRSPWGWWHDAHAESSTCGPPVWVALGPNVVPSWQEAQAAFEGYVYQTFDWVASGVWQRTQLRMSWGKTTSEKLCSDWLLPMMMYGVPASTLGRDEPM